MWEVLKEETQRISYCTLIFCRSKPKTLQIHWLAVKANLMHLLQVFGILLFKPFSHASYKHLLTMKEVFFFLQEQSTNRTAPV